MHVHPFQMEQLLKLKISIIKCGRIYFVVFSSQHSVSKPQQPAQNKGCLGRALTPSCNPCIPLRLCRKGCGLDPALNITCALTNVAVQGEIGKDLSLGQLTKVAALQSALCYSPSRECFDQRGQNQGLSILCITAHRQASTQKPAPSETRPDKAPVPGGGLLDSMTQSLGFSRHDVLIIGQ